MPMAADLLADLQLLGHRLGRALRGNCVLCACAWNARAPRSAIPAASSTLRRQALDDFGERAARALHTATARRRADLRSLSVTSCALFSSRPLQKRSNRQR